MRLLILGGEPRKHSLHRLHLGEIAQGTVVAAALTGSQAKSSRGVEIPRSDSAQMHERRETLLLRERCRTNVMASKRIRHAAIQIG